MHHFVDRRLNPKDKNLGNRQRFIRRARAQIKKSIQDTVRGRKIADVEGGEQVSIPTKGITEPRLRNSPTGGHRERVFNGNKEFVTGDRLKKPNAGAGGRGRKASESGEGQDEFQFALSREEFLDLFFEDLELPDLVKKDLKEIRSFKLERAGYTTAGSPVRLAVKRTMSNSLGRRVSLRRPRESDVEDVRERIREAEADYEHRAGGDEGRNLALLREEEEQLLRRRSSVAFIDPIDVRFRNYTQRPTPNTKAVMFCLMDVSGSMGEREKDLAKRFFILLHLFLKRRYEKIDVVFIRHTHEAQVVDEDTFFYSRESGGTIVSSALKEMKTQIQENYSPTEWNIYAAQASDGENFSGDSDKCAALLKETLMPVCQYYAYVEILDEREIELFGESQTGAALWRCYRTVAEEWENFAMKRIARPSDIYPVFRELFARTPAG